MIPETPVAYSPTSDIAAWVELCGNCGQLFAITGGTDPQGTFQDIRCPACQAFWGRSPSNTGFQTKVLEAPAPTSHRD